MAVNGISGTGITGTLSNGSNAIDSAVLQNEAKKFSSLVKEMQNKTALGISEGASKISLFLLRTYDVNAVNSQCRIAFK